MILGNLVTVFQSIKASLLPYKYYIIGGVIALVLGMFFYIGYRYSSYSCEKDKRQALEAMIKYQEGVLAENDKINAEIIEDLNSKDEEIRIAYKKVAEYVKNNPDRTNCELDSAGLRMWDLQTNPN